ncbi:MAG: energy-coupling factor transporter transmembrane component T [Acidobacteriota bacterium]|nr:energy-coupling factor transporter transmembrane component T [Acidobacteriota bacterium]
MKGRVDPRLKALVFASAAATAAFSGFARLGALAFLCLVLHVIAGISVRRLWLRILPVVPLLLFLSITLIIAGYWGPGRGGEFLQSGLMASRTFVILWALFLFSATTPLPELVRALAALRCPRPAVDILFFSSRYQRLLLREAERIRQALVVRAAANRKALLKARVLSRLLSRPVDKAFERSERIHAAMLARGWAGRLPVRPLGRFSLRDVFFGGIAGAWISASWMFLR